MRRDLSPHRVNGRRSRDQQLPMRRMRSDARKLEHRLGPTLPAGCRSGRGARKLSNGLGIAPRMATIVRCNNCSAEYRRTEEKFLVPHTGHASCTVCGAALESWRESPHVPTYELVERPERKPE